MSRKAAATHLSGLARASENDDEAWMAGEPSAGDCDALRLRFSYTGKVT